MVVGKLKYTVTRLERDFIKRVRSPRQVPGTAESGLTKV